jgi:2-oxoglutarate-Fe(II)-dependent oxygenase superfamily protein
MSGFVEEAPGVVRFRLYEPAECDSILAFLGRSDGWNEATFRELKHDGTYASRRQPELRSGRVLALDALAELRREFDCRMEAVVKPLVTRVWGVRLAEHSGTQVVQYRAGERYRAHADAGLDLDQRYFTVLCYLNDDFAGGHTGFPSLGYTAAPCRGTAILFPSRYFHSAEPVIAGEKLVIVSWITGPAQIRWI